MTPREIQLYNAARDVVASRHLFSKDENSSRALNELRAAVEKYKEGSNGYD